MVRYLDSGRPVRKSEFLKYFFIEMQSGKDLTDCKLSLDAIFAQVSELDLMVVIFSHHVNELP